MGFSTCDACGMGAPSGCLMNTRMLTLTEGPIQNGCSQGEWLAQFFEICINVYLLSVLSYC